MTAQTMASTICYVPQAYFTDGTLSVSAASNIDSIENSGGLWTPDLSDFMTIIPDVGENEFAFNMNFTRGAVPQYEGFPVTCGYIGCSMLTYEDDGGGNPDYTTEVVEDTVMAQSWSFIVTGFSGSGQKFSFAKNSSNRVTTFDDTTLSGIISGGTTNVLFSGFGSLRVSSGTGAGQCVVTRSTENTTLRPHARFQIGHMFVGIDVPVTLDPRTFSWGIKASNRKHKARDEGTISSEGTLTRQASFEVRGIMVTDLMGLEVDEDFESINSANFLDLIKVNNSYPVLFNPYPAVAPGTGSLTAEQAMMTARQNFFSIYGFLDGGLELQNSEYRNGLDSEYRARFRIMETR